MQRTYKYIIISFLLCLTLFSVQAQEEQTMRKAPEAKVTDSETPEIKIPEVKWWNGFTVQTDIASLINSSLAKGITYSMEGAIQVDLKHKFYPVFELGYAGADKISNDNVGFKTNALFGRVGVDFNLIKQKPESDPTNNLFFIGLRLGMTHFN